MIRLTSVKCEKWPIAKCCCQIVSASNLAFDQLTIGVHSNYNTICMLSCNIHFERICVIFRAPASNLVRGPFPYHFPIFQVTFPIFGPGVLACATRGGGRSEAGHCFHLLFSSFSSFSFFFFLLFLRLLLFTHFGESPVRENLFPPIFWHN